MTTDTLTLSAFLLARIEEDERRRFGSDWTAARVSAECVAKRAIVELHDRPHECSTFDHNGEIDNCTWCIDASDCSTLRALAAVYADHRDYNPRWA